MSSEKDPHQPTRLRAVIPPALAHLLGSAVSMWPRLVALVAITAACLGIFVGGLSAIDSTLTARDEWAAQGRLADIEVRFDTVPEAQVPDFSTADGVDGHRVRASLMGTVDVPDNDHLSLQLVAGQADADVEINRLVLLEGESLSESDTTGMLIDWHLADSHGVRVGDTLTVTLAGEELDLTVRGIVRDAEFLLSPANPSLFVPSKGSLGIGFVNLDTVSELLGFTPANSVVVRLESGADAESARQEILEIASGAQLSQAYVLGSDEQFASLFMEKNLAAFATVIPVIVLVTGLSSIFVTFFLLAQWLAKERRPLGVLMTLGYTSGHLARAFAVVLAFLAIASMVAGMVVAYFLARAFIGQYAMSVGLPVAQTRLTWAYIVGGCSAIAVVFVSAGAYTSWMVSRTTPLDAMRAVTRKQTHPGVLAGWLGAHLPTSWLRIAVRNTVRDKVVSGLTVVSMALGFGITASFFIAFSSVITTAQSQINASTWDLTVDFREPLTEGQCGDAVRGAGVSEWTCTVKGAVQASAHGAHTNIFVGGYDPTRLWYAIPMLLEGHDVNGEEPNGILLEISTANELGVGLGDMVELDSTTGHHSAEIVGLFSSALPGESRFTSAFAQEVFGIGDTYTGAFLKVAKSDNETVLNAVSENTGVQQVLTREGIRADIVSLSDQITSILHLGSAVSVVVALLFVMACLGYTVVKRGQDYQLLRCLGYKDGVVRATILTETGILGILAMVLAIPIGAVTAQYTGWRISQVWFHVNTTLTVSDYALTFVPALLLLPVVALPMARTVLRQSLDEFMRLRELG